MKKFATIVGIAMLAACNQGAADAPVAEESAAAPEAAAPTVANGSPVGTYAVTAADGTQFTAAINADGTYSDTAADGKVFEEGTWAVIDGKTCFTPKADGATPECFTETPPRADGSFTATSDKGNSVTVKPATAS
jgi:hypothetical protein